MDRFRNDFLKTTQFVRPILQWKVNNKKKGKITVSSVSFQKNMFIGCL